MNNQPAPIRLGCTPLLILLICLLAVAVCQAQITPKQVDSIRNIVAQELAPKISAELQKEFPLYITCFSIKRMYYAPIFVINGYNKGGVYLDSKHRPLPSWIKVATDAHGVPLIMDRVKQVPFKKSAINKP